MNTSNGKKLIFLGVSIVLYANVPPPSTSIIIQNKTHCQLSLAFEQALIAQLTLPSEISSFGSSDGEITFSASWFSPSSQQQANAQYVVNCDGINHMLTLDFFAGLGHIADHDYFFQASTNHDSPFLIIPAGKVLIQDQFPLVITLINKEDKYEASHYFTNAEPNNDNGSTTGETPNCKPDPVSDIPSISSKPQSIDDNPVKTT